MQRYPQHQAARNSNFNACFQACTTQRILLQLLSSRLLFKLLYIFILDTQQICITCCLHLDAQQLIHLQEGLIILPSSTGIRMNALFLLSPLSSACQCCDSLLPKQYLSYWMKKCVSQSLLPSASVNIGFLFRITLLMEFVEPVCGWRELSISLCCGCYNLSSIYPVVKKKKNKKTQKKV